MANLIVENVRQEQTGVATGMNAVTRTLGGAFGGQLAATLLAGNVAAGGIPTNHGFTLAFLMCLVALVGALGFAFAVPRRGGSRLSRLRSRSRSPLDGLRSPSASPPSSVPATTGVVGWPRMMRGRARFGRNDCGASGNRRAGGECRVGQDPWKCRSRSLHGVVLAPGPDRDSAVYGHVDSKPACLTDRKVDLKAGYDTESGFRPYDAAITGQNGGFTGIGPLTHDGNGLITVKAIMKPKDIGTKRHPKTCKGDTFRVVE